VIVPLLWSLNERNRPMGSLVSIGLQHRSRQKGHLPVLSPAGKPGTSPEETVLSGLLLSHHFG